MLEYGRSQKHLCPMSREVKRIESRDNSLEIIYKSVMPNIFFLLEICPVLCPGSSQMHQTNTENPQTRDSAGSQMLLLVEERFCSCSTIWLITLLSNYVLQCHLMKLCSITQQAVIQCNVENECVSQVTHHQPCFLKAASSSFFSHPLAGRENSRKEEIAGHIRPKAINRVVLDA